MWRGAAADPWHVQPFVYSAGQAVAIANKLLAQFRGETFTARVDLPAGSRL
jgi:hypothetical protein